MAPRPPGPFDLCRLADLRDAASSGDDEIQRLITAVSRTMLTMLNRPNLLPHTVTETRRSGGGGIVLAQWPVTSVQAVTLGGIPSAYDLEPADDAPPGRPQWLTLAGLARGRDAPWATITYTAGYQVTDAPKFVPASAPYTVTPAAPHGAWACDVGVTSATGGALARVASQPGPGQYSVEADGTYTLSGAEAGKAIALSYGYVPADLANAAVDWIRDRIAYADRIGMQSRSLGGQETVSYKIAATPDFVAAILAQYAATVPLC